MYACYWQSTCSKSSHISLSSCLHLSLWHAFAEADQLKFGHMLSRSTHYLEPFILHPWSLIISPSIPQWRPWLQRSWHAENGTHVWQDWGGVTFVPAFRRWTLTDTSKSIFSRLAHPFCNCIFPISWALSFLSISGLINFNTFFMMSVDIPSGSSHRSSSFKKLE